MYRPWIILVISPLIMVATAVTSFKAQHAVFLGWEVDSTTAVVAPLSIDLLALLCSLAIHIPGLPTRTKVTAVIVLILTGAGSMVANWMAGETNGSKVVHAAMVLLYLLAESIASQVEEYVAKVMAMRRAASDAEVKAAAVVDTVKASDAEAPELPEAPVSPAPSGPRKGRPKRDTVEGPQGLHVEAGTGAPLPVRTERRARTGK